MSATIQLHPACRQGFAVAVRQLDGCVTIKVAESAEPGATAVTLFFDDQTAAQDFLRAALDAAHRIGPAR